MRKTTSPSLPIRRFNTVYHVGQLNVTDKKRNSLEGSGLSVSIHPNEWTTIAKLGGGKTFQLKKDDHAFLDFYARTLVFLNIS